MVRHLPFFTRLIPSALLLMSRKQLTVTVSPEAGQFVEEVSAELGVKKSAVVEHALELARERRIEDLLREGYEERAEHDRKLLKDQALG